jgi:tetratricopeptide (TPR) repeat protein
MQTATSLPRRILLLGSLILIVSVSQGCKKKIDPALYADTTVAFNDGIKAYEAGEFEKSVTALTAAIDGYGLSPDQFATAIVRRAVSYGRLGKFTEAHKDLDEAERGAPNMDEVFQARHFVFSAEGNKTKAAEALREAKKLNSRIKSIK